MTKKIFIGLFFLLVCQAVHSKTVSIQDFFKNPAMTNVKISPDGTHIAFTVFKDKEHFLTIVNRETKEAHGYEYGNSTRVFDFHWVSNSRIIVEAARFVGFLDTKGGRPSIWGINVDGSKRTLLFDGKANSGYRILSLLENDPEKILIEKYHFADEGVSKIHSLNVNNGNLDYLADQPSEGVSRSIVNSKGSARLGFRYEEKGNDEFGKGTTSIYYKKPNTEKWNKLNFKGFKPGNNLQPIAISKDDRYAYFLSDVETKTNALFQFDLKNGTRQMIFHNETVDLGSPVFVGDRELIGIRYDEDFDRIKFIDNEHPKTNLYKSLYASFPDSNVYITSTTADDRLSVIYVNSDTNPGDYYLFDNKEKRLSMIGKSRPWIKPEDMAQMNPILYTARDGTKIHGYLTLPQGKRKDLPLIINPHGGPHGPRDKWSFNPEVQFLANRGYAVLQMNFRGSGGYGKEFEQTGYRKWGREMQDDVTDATLWAIEKGIADKDRICIYGGSYGGYATLAGVVREPDLYKCGLGYVGVYDLPTMKVYGDIPQSRFGQKYLDKVLGTSDEELMANSPARHVDRIKADLFIAHGEDDIRVPMEQYEVLKKNLDAIGKPFKSMLKDEGHGYQKEENRYEFYGEMEKFFKKNIGN